MKIKLYDTNFSHHTPGSSISSFPDHDTFPKHIEWIRDSNVETKVAIFTDNCLDKVLYSPHEYDIAWIIEPRCLVPNVYDQISNPDLYNKFDKILTHDSELLKLDPNKFIPCPLFGAWVSLEDSANYWPKTENICIIASHKNQLPGHKFRHEIISKLSSKYDIHVYGNGYNRFDKAVDVLKKYRYCIVVENVKDGYWITEKLITPILCGCIPIYYGSPNVYDYFLAIPSFDSIEGLERQLSISTEENYKVLVEYGIVNKTFNKAMNYRVLEDWIYENILKGIYD